MGFTFPLEAGETWLCGPESAGQRLDLFINARAPDHSRSRIQKWIEQGCFAINGKPARKNHAMVEGDAVTLLVAPERKDLTLKPEDIPLEVVYEDEHILVVDKAKGMVTHPGNGTYDGTLANALAFRFKNLSDVNGPLRPGIVHRLDKDTSGLLVVAKTNAAHFGLAKQLEAHTVSRVYHALIWREVSNERGTVDKPIARNPRDPLKMGVHPDGKRAVTHYRTLGFFQFATHLEIRLETGRTHQIRVHMASLEHPVVGDPVYGGREAYLGRIQPILHPFATRLLSYFPSQALHAHKLSFAHPISGVSLELESPLPPEMRAALDFLEKFRHEPDSRT